MLHRSKPKVYDFVVLGSGIIGINIATVLKQTLPGATVCVLEKEPLVGYHASGRNSGVLHAGFYYHPDSWKAKLTREGNIFLTRYCKQHEIPFNPCGKLVVAKNEHDLQGLDTLFQRGKQNGVPVEEVNERQAKQLEPLVKTYQRALFSPSTAAADPLKVLQHQYKDAQRLNIDFLFNYSVKELVQRTAFGTEGKGGITIYPSTNDSVTKRNGNTRSDKDNDSSVTLPVIETGHVINCAGVYADVFAKQLNFGQDIGIAPFKGLYMYCDLPLQRLVYPVPDLNQPFLGVHFTVTFNNQCKIGPTAIPALWREQYGNFFNSYEPLSTGFSSWSELLEITQQHGSLIMNNPNLRSLAKQEIKKYLKRYMIQGAAELVEGATASRFHHFGRAGIRPQFVNRRTHELLMDYIVEGDATSTHVLNTISPGWTCSRPFAEIIVKRYILK